MIDYKGKAMEDLAKGFDVEERWDILENHTLRGKFCS
jgi:hypothetical protein